MSDLKDIVDVTISRETQTISRASYGVFAIISEFLEGKTTVTFERYRYYASLAEMTTDGWSIADDEYLAAQIVFSQNPKLPRIMVGRKTPDAEAVETWTAALTAIQAAQPEWYGFMLITSTEADLLLAAAWAETQIKIFFYADSEADIITTGVLDLPYQLKALNYDRSMGFYHTAAQQDTTPSWIEAAAPGEAFPYDPGSQTWAYKTLAGVASYELTSTERTNALGKNCNIYTATAGVNITEEGKVASGEYTDIIRGLDWLTSLIMENIFIDLITLRKIPYTDSGVALIEANLKGSLSTGADQGVVVASSIVVTVPAVADIDVVDKGNRLLPDINFTATLQGAIQKVEINGVVTL